MQIVRGKISLDELKKMSEKMFDRLVKAVVDIEKEIMVVDAGLHADEEQMLLDEAESKQEHLWGINLYPDKFPAQSWIVFDSMINLRPSQGNRSRGVDSSLVQEKIRAVVATLVVE
jgi:hypothetical protein